METPIAMRKEKIKKIIVINSSNNVPPSPILNKSRKLKSFDILGLERGKKK